MNNSELKAFLSGTQNEISTLSWLQETFMPLVVSRLNDTSSRKRLALYGGDRIPENERNLTDFRNRISLIIEYEFARVITSILEEYGASEMFCSYVVANRFPDLEMRNSDGSRGLRFEVKCLQSTAEEKSANFSTLRKDLMPTTDYLTVFLWDWNDDNFSIGWDRAPNILESYVFNASALATLRDWYWLNKPPSTLGSGYQGFDIRYAVNCVNSHYNEEEGNLGKLLRIWKQDLDHVPPKDPLLLATETNYLVFKEEVVVKGFEVLAKKILPLASGKNNISDARYDGSKIGKVSGNCAFFRASQINGTRKIQQAMNKLGVTIAWILQDKYQWKEYRVESNEFLEVCRGRKPKGIVNRLTGD